MVKFLDASQNRGKVWNSEGEYKWEYNGEFNSILSALINQERDRTVSSPSDKSTSNSLVDNTAPLTSKDKVVNAFQRLHPLAEVFSLKINGEVIY